MIVGLFQNGRCVYIYIYIPSTYGSPGEISDDGQEPIEIDGDEDREEELAAKQLKKAGVPELHPDDLPSTVATKMLNLELTFQRVKVWDVVPTWMISLAFNKTV